MADCKAYNMWRNSLFLDNGSYVGINDISFIFYTDHVWVMGGKLVIILYRKVYKYLFVSMTYFNFNKPFWVREIVSPNL